MEATAAASSSLPSPSPMEFAATVALLLLSDGSVAAAPPPPPPPLPLSLISCDEISSSGNVTEVDSSSCISNSRSSTSDLRSSNHTPLQILAIAAALCHELNSKILHKQNAALDEHEKKEWRQSDPMCYYYSGGADAKEAEEDEAASSLSSTSSTTAGSGPGSARLRAETQRARDMASGGFLFLWKRSSQSRSKAGSNRRAATSSIRRRAVAIMDFLHKSGVSASEILIREAVGNSPDTSKALRMLLKMGKVKRSGTGGRADPFTYTVAVAVAVAELDQE